MQELIFEIRKKSQVTIIFVTHDVEEAVCLGDRIVLLTPRPGTINKIWNLSEREFAGLSRGPAFRQFGAFVEVEREVLHKSKDVQNEKKRQYSGHC
jgi:NitT/TauT family transport system ATP-binding protein